jgi:hypothetical protein
MTLLASAPSLEMIQESIARFYCGEAKDLEPETGKPNSWLVTGSTGTPLLGVRVVKRGKRFRFEMVA